MASTDIEQLHRVPVSAPDLAEARTHGEVAANVLRSMGFVALFPHPLASEAARRWSAMLRRPT
jgi:hypothetical protein